VPFLEPLLAAAVLAGAVLALLEAGGGRTRAVAAA
jgi:hypothetical protein